VEEKLLLATRELVNKNKTIFKALHKLCTRETHEVKELHLLEISKAESKSH
jgi:hypothetical protein